MFRLFLYGFELQKIGKDEVSYTIDLKKGEVIKGMSFFFMFTFVLLSDWNLDLPIIICIYLRGENHEYD
jgi:hypothetical protein